MLFMMRGTLFYSVLPCSHGVCEISPLSCSVLLKPPFSCSCSSVTLWGWHTKYG